MNKYIERFAEEFLRDIKKLRDEKLKKRLVKKRNEIIDNPHSHKSLRNVLKGKQRVHIGSYVLIYEIKETEKTILFHRFQHHDKVYKKKL